MKNKKHLKIGIILFLTSFIIGYGSLLVTGFFYFITRNDIWIWSGSGLYGLSWILFGIGFVMAGREGLKYFKCKQNDF